AYTMLGVLLLPAGAQFGVEPTIAALVVCNLALLPSFLLCARRVAQIDVINPLAIFPKVAVAAALMFLAVTAWRLIVPEHTPQLIIIGCAIGIGALAYSAIAFLLIRADIARACDMLPTLRPSSAG